MSEAKTEEPTPRRERNAREEGRVWQSRDLALGAVLTVTGGLVRFGASDARRALVALFEDGLARAIATTPLAASEAIEASVLSGARLVMPWLAAIVIVGATVSALQVGGVLAPAAFAPDASRLDPTARFGAGGGARLGSSVLLGLARFGLLGAVAIATCLEALPGIATLARQPVDAALAACVALAAALTLRMGIALVALGVIDAIVERALYRASLRMTRRERDREQREVEGDAHVRRERERAREELRRESDLDEVRHAVLVVTDADAVAVALSYDAGDPDAVPRVAAIARGDAQDELLRESRDHGVPKLDEGELATQLAALPIGAPIPDALFEPVARAMTRAGAA